MNMISLLIMALTMSFLDYFSIDLLLVALVALVILAYFYYRVLVQLKHVKIRARKNEEVKSSFLTHINNALRAPLSTINHNCQALEEYEYLTPEERQNIVSAIKRDSNQMYAYLNELEELTNFDGAIPALSMIEVNVAELILSYRREILHETNKGVMVSIQTTLSPHCRATMDTTMFRQLIMLLLRISAQRTQEGSITINYEMERSGLRFTLSDTSEPIPEEIRGLLFTSMLNKDGMVQLEDKTSVTVLNICKSIIDAMQGTIEALPSKDGCGAIITFWFPCRIRFR